jgi:DNA-binding NtrC family response regulator
VKDKPRILVVEDQDSERRALERLLRLAKFDVVTAVNAEEAAERIGEPIDLVISDMCMAQQSGMDLLEAWKEARPGLPFVLVTAFSDVDSAVHAMKLGATDYLTKPVNPDQLLELVRTILSRAGTYDDPEALADIVGDHGFGALVGRSPAMLDVFDKIRRAAQTDSLVLVLGESGAGKELVAASIHQNSKRSAGPYVPVNMAAIPENLVESELFGHVRGAFTGATTTRVGRFESAHGGTIFIDEIGDFDPGAQAKLLRVLETLTVCPVGSNEEIQVDVRVVAATSRNLPELVATGIFREDLYYRLNVVQICIPALRERHADIPLLADVFLRQSAAACEREPMTIDDRLLNHLVHYYWPGNVRQLRNTIHSMVVLARGDLLTLDDLPPDIVNPKEPAVIQERSSRDLEMIERAAILSALKKHSGNRTRAAAALGISVRTLQRKLKSWGIASDSRIGSEPGE